MEDNKTEEAKPEVTPSETLVEENSVIDMAQEPDEHEASKPQQAVSGVVKKSKINKKLLIIVASALILIIVGVLFYLFIAKDKKPSTNSSATTSSVAEKKTTETQKIEPEIDPALKKLVNPSTGETWLSSRKPVADLGYIKVLPDEGVEIKYYEVGKRAGNTIYLSSEHMLGELIYLFEKSPTGEVKMIGQPSSLAVYNDEEQKTAKDSLSSKVGFDTSIHYDSLSIPSKIGLKNGHDVTSINAFLGNTIDEVSDKKNEGKYSELAKYGSSVLQKFEYSNPETNLMSVSYYITLPISTRVALNYEPISTDMSRINFTTGFSYVDDKMSAITRGCGSLLSSVSRADNAKDTDFKKAGLSSSGQNVYEAIDSNYGLVTKAYQEFKDFYSSDTDTYKKNMTKEEFIKNHSIVFFKDKENQWLVYTRDGYRPAAGCAKPVVYLYPTTAQNVSVKVGAKVKVSDPLYDPINGWKNVWADPSGLLSFGGKQYSSLFWEGPGYGAYPNVSRGTVVKTSEAIATIRGQLSVQGFNNNEINDFVDYWAPNMPNKPYVRLTWFDTDQMNQLAPLNIVPKPDTLIRTFLDFEGLDNLINIPAQTFEKTPRTGFTVTEWGGLSAKKLY